MLNAHFVSAGSYLPKKVVTNDDLAHQVETSDEWIKTRTGIEERHIASEEETTVFMACEAAKRALAAGKVSPSEIDGIIIGTTTPDQVFPSVATRVQAALGMENAFAFDLSAACSGFIYGLSTANAFLKSGQAKKLLVIGVETFSRLLDWTDRTTCVLFGDGAGAFILEASEKEGGIIASHLHADGKQGDILYVDGAVGCKGTATTKMNGKEVFRHAVERLSQAVDEVLDEQNLKGTDIDWLVPHQANQRIISAVAKRLGLPSERVISTVAKHANTSAASVPLAFVEGLKDGRIKKGDLVLMEALGGGLTWGSVLMRI